MANECRLLQYRLISEGLSPDTIKFVREKTKRTKRENPVNIVVVRNARINAILDKWCRKGDDNTGGLLFDILSYTDHPAVVRKKVQLFLVRNGAAWRWRNRLSVMPVSIQQRSASRDLSWRRRSSIPGYWLIFDKK